MILYNSKLGIMFGRKIVIAIFLMVNTSLFCQGQWREKSIEVPVIKNKNEQFIILMANVINFEKQCDYYNDSLCFLIFVHENAKGDSIFIYIEVKDKTDFDFDFIPVGFFQQQNHNCFVYENLTEILFEPVRKNQLFVYNKWVGNTPKLKKRNPVIKKIESENDSDFWLYVFVGNKFQLLDHFSWCE